MKFDKSKVVVLLVLLVAVGGAVAYSVFFTAGSGTSYETDTGLTVSTNVDHGLNDSNPFVDNSTLYVDGVSFSAAGPAQVTVEEFRGNRTRLSSIDATTHAISVDPDDKSAIEISGDVTALAWENASLDGTAQLTYSATGSGTIVVDGLQSNVSYAAVTTGGTLLSSGETSDSGEATVDVVQGSDQDVVLLQPSSATVSNADAQPSDGSSTDTLDVTLSVPVSDRDFASDAGDEVQATFYLDGDAIATQNITANGSVSTSTTVDVGGSHSWHVELVDSYGLTSESEVFSFETPSKLQIYNESDPSQLVDQNVSVEIRVYDDDADTTRVYERTTSDGSISLAGLPIDGFTVIARADGFYFRRIYVQSLYDQQEVFLLPTSVAANYQVFTLDDRSGQYSPGETRLEIRRALNQSGTLEWRTISGDQFGAANSYKTYLRDDVRYRLYVINENGDRRLIGSYMSLDEVNPKQILVRDVRVEVPDGDRYSAVAYVTDNDVLTFAYRDLADQTDELRLKIHERGNSSNVLEETTVASVNGNWTYSRSLSGDNANTSWVVDWSVDRNGQTHDGSIPVGSTGSMDVPIDGAWLQRFALLAIPIVAALASERIATYGALGAVAFAGMLMVFGWLQIHPMLWFAAATIAIGGHAWVISQRGGTVG